MTAAIGMACGAGLVLLALAVTAAHFIVVFLYPGLAIRLRLRATSDFGCVSSTRTAAASCARSSPRAQSWGLAIHQMATQQIEGGPIAGIPAVAVTFEVRGKPTVEELTVALDKLDGVLGVENH